MSSIPQNTTVPNRPLATARPWEVCGISRAQWFRLAASSKTPLPVRLGTRRPVYLIAELESWLLSGAPDRRTWLGMRASCLGGESAIARTPTPTPAAGEEVQHGR
jgi:predicted DNA-binding transcriptional regulator AlpA